MKSQITTRMFLMELLPGLSGKVMKLPLHVKVILLQEALVVKDIVKSVIYVSRVLLSNLNLLRLKKQRENYLENDNNIPVTSAF